jgi:hypothetical protein
MSEAETRNQQSLSPADSSSTNSPPSGSEMVATSTDTKSLSQHGIRGIEPTHSLIDRNRNLLQQVGQLEQALRQYQEELQFQQARAQTQETQLLQHKELLKASEDQVNRLFKELESSHQINQRQQILVETLSTQLEASQERLALLERECALTQQRNHEQSLQLQQTETSCEELQVRLERQQKQALQFKAALEKSIETSPPNYLKSEADKIENFWLQSPSNLSPDASAVNLEHIAADYLDESEWENLPQAGFEFISPSPDLKSEARAENSASNLPDKSSGVNLPYWQKQPPTPATTDAVDESLDFVADTVEIEFPAKAAETSEKDRLTEALKEVPDRPSLSLDEAIAAAWNEELVEKREYQPTVSQEITVSQFEEGEHPEYELELEPEPEVENANKSLLSGINWPSPLVNPLRPTKRLKSWAAIDLPRFPKFRRSSR